MDEREEFIKLFIAEDNMSATCRAFGISRETGYKWWERYEEEGLEGLIDRSRAPRRHPNETPSDIVDLILAARADHPNWGARKLIAWLEPRHRGKAFPAPSTVAAMLKRHGLVVARKRRRRTRPTGKAPVADAGPNSIWATDFKGEFRMRDGRWCYPLTLQDVCSRYLLRCQGLRTCGGDLAKPVFEAAFREYGVPDRILSDNGSPFASSSFSGLTPLSAWWVKLGIDVLRTKPGHPEQNGRLERLHRTLKQETARPPQSNLRAQQLSFNQFRQEYNDERPHEALGQRPPASAYQCSARSYCPRIREPDYPGHFDVRRLNTSGELHFRGYRVTISKALRHDRVALEEFDDGRWHIHFHALALGTFDEHTATLARPGYSVKARRDTRKRG